MDKSTVASMIDHTLLRPEATMEDVANLVRAGEKLGVHSVCVSPSCLPLPVTSNLKVAAVCGFPSGAHKSEVKALEAAKAVDDGAEEIDMVINLRFAKEHNFEGIKNEVGAVRAALPSAVCLKVIIESAALTDEEIVAVCKASVDGGADFVKTSTGFHPSGGASVAAVALMRSVVGPNIGVKASGGIRDAKTALAMIEAGANRLGLSASEAILAEL